MIPSPEKVIIPLGSHNDLSTQTQFRFGDPVEEFVDGTVGKIIGGNIVGNVGRIIGGTTEGTTGGGVVPFRR
jgi:hypothetical protein